MWRYNGCDENDLYGVSTNIQFYNNVAYDARHFPDGREGDWYTSQRGESDIYFRNNIGYGHGDNLGTWRNPSGSTLKEGVTQSNNLFGVDPKFVDAANNNFHLQSNSPAKDTGTSVGAPAFDFDGYKRPVGSGFDIGAYEYCAGAECVLDPNAGSSGNLPPSCTAPTIPVCPDGVCNGMETSSTCPADCPFIPPPCTPTLTCADYPFKCNINLFNGCTSTLDCSGSCTAPASECNVSTWICRVPATAPTIAPILTTAPLTKAIELRWTPVSGQGYKIYRDNILIATVTGLYYRDVPGDLISHNYQVLAYNSIGNGPMSAISAMAASSVPVTNMKKLIPIDNFKELIANIFKYSLSIAGGIGLLVIIIGGIMYMGGAGSEQRTMTGKKAITYAIAGLILIFLAYSISAIVERILM